MRQDRINKVPIITPEGDIQFINQEEKAEGIYLPYACFVTSMARNITIRSAQKCYDEKIVNEDGEKVGRFVYADTDSIHIIGDPPKDLWVDNTALGAWKLEGRFPIAKYLRPKTYIHCNEDYTVYVKWKKSKTSGKVEMIPEGIKCAGMPDAIKKKLVRAGGRYAWDNFYIGNKFEGKLSQFRVPGGVIIRETTYELKEQTFRSGLL